MVKQDLAFPNPCWLGWCTSHVWHKQLGRFLECVKTSLQVIEEPTRGAILDLVLTHREELWGNALLQGSSDCRNCGMVELELLRAVRRAHRKLIALEFRKATFGLCKDLLGRVPRDRALRTEGWLDCKDCLLQAQEQCMPTRRKSGKNARKPP